MSEGKYDEWRRIARKRSMRKAEVLEIIDSAELQHGYWLDNLGRANRLELRVKELERMLELVTRLLETATK